MCTCAWVTSCSHTHVETCTHVCVSVCVSYMAQIIDLGACADLRSGTNYTPDESILDPNYCPPEQVCVCVCVCCEAQ